MTTALKNNNIREPFLRILWKAWPEYHKAKMQHRIAWTMGDKAEVKSWRSEYERLQRVISQACEQLSIKPVECPTCGTLIRNIHNNDGEILPKSKTMPSDPDTPKLEGFE